MSCTQTLTRVRNGDTWDGLPECGPSSVDADIDDPLALVRMTFTLAGASTPALTLSSADASQITIDDAAGYVFSVLPRTMTLAAGFYSWAIELTDDADRIQTPTGGTGTIEILADT